MPSGTSKTVSNLPVITFDGVDDYMDVLSPVLRDYLFVTTLQDAYKDSSMRCDVLVFWDATIFL